MSKRIISAILSIVFITVTVLPCLSGCNAVENENYYTVLEWLDQIENSFNLLYYSETEPLVKTVNTSDNSFETVQIAAEWGVIEPEDDLRFNDRLTKELAADTLIRAMNCVTLSTIDISDSGDVKPLYLERVMSAVNEGIFTLDSGKFSPKKQLTKDEANAAMLIAHDKWINFSYEGVSYDHSTIKENVINLGGVRSENSTIVPVQYSVEYSGSTRFVDENGTYTDNTSKTRTFPAGQSPAGLGVDMVLAMPADDVMPMDYAVVVTGLTENGDGSVTVTTRKAELEDVYEEIDIQQSGELDFSDAIFFGPDGQRLDLGAGSVDNTSALMNNWVDSGIAYNPQLYRSNGDIAKLSTSFTTNMMYNLGTDYSSNYVQKLGMEKKDSTTFKLGDVFSVTLSTKTGNGGVGLGVKLEGKVEADGASLKVETGFDQTVKVESHIKTHWDWFKLKVDELKLSLTDEKTETFGFDCSLVKNFGSTKNQFLDHNGDGKTNGADWTSEAAVLRNLYNDVRHVSKSWSDLKKQANDVANFKLVDIFMPSIGAHFVIRGELSVDGSLKLTFKQANTVGVELMNGKLRPYNEKSNSQEVDFSAKIELAFRVALEWQLIGINVCDIGVKAGIGAKVSSILYSYDKSTDSLLEICGIQSAAIKPGGSIAGEDGVTISETGLVIQTEETSTTRICSELSVYPILSFYVCSSSSVAGKLLGGVDLEILGENTPLFRAHFDDGVLVSECSVSANDSYGITTGDNLSLNSDSYALPVGEEADEGLALVTLPKNATIKDVKITSDNPEVLEVENLLHKTTGFEKSSVKPKITFRVNSAYLKDESTEGNPTEYSYTFGSWFYDDVAGKPKPHFALTGKKNGTANVTVSAGGESVTIPVQVGTGEEPVVSTGDLISSKGTFTLAPGEKVQTAFDFIPEGKTIDDISFTTEDSSIATVSSGGLISAVDEGDVKIIAILQGEKKEYKTEFVVHVIEQTVTYTSNGFINTYSVYIDPALEEFVVI